MNTRFSAWLAGQMNRIGVNASGLAGLLGLKHPSVLAWIDGTSEPKPVNCVKLARVLGVPQAEVYEALGRIPPDERETPEVRRLITKYNRLPPSEQRKVEALVDASLAEIERGE
jgi:DNA-binding transcriptional regulator YdaS (Cro superfamily)